MATLAHVVEVYDTCRTALADAGLPPGVPYCAGRPGGQIWLGWRFGSSGLAVGDAVCRALECELGRYVEAVCPVPGRVEMSPRRTWLMDVGEDLPHCEPEAVVDVPADEPWDVLRERALFDAGAIHPSRCGPVLAPTLSGQDTLLTRLTLLSVPPRKAVKLTEGWAVRNSTSRGFRVLLAFSAAAKLASCGVSDETDCDIHCESSAFNALRVFVSTARSLSVGDPSFCVRSMMDYAEDFLDRTDRSPGTGRRVAGALFESSRAMKLALPQQV